MQLSQVLRWSCVMSRRLGYSGGTKSWHGVSILYLLQICSWVIIWKYNSFPASSFTIFEINWEFWAQFVAILLCTIYFLSSIYASIFFVLQSKCMCLMSENQECVLAIFHHFGAWKIVGYWECTIVPGCTHTISFVDYLLYTTRTETTVWMSSSQNSHSIKNSGVRILLKPGCIMSEWYLITH